MSARSLCARTALLLALPLACVEGRRASAPRATLEPEAPRAVTPQGSAVRPPPRTSSRLRVTVLARLHNVGWDLRLAAVDAATHRVTLWEQSGGSVSVRAHDLATGDELERWDVRAPSVPHAGRFVALTGSLSSDLARYAALLGEDGGAWHTPGIVVPPGGRHVLYGVDLPNGRDGDAWHVADRAGHPLFPFAPGLRAYYDLSFSPDGARVAFSGCCHATTPGGNPYHLYLAELTGRPREVVSVPYPSGSVFAADGASLWVASRRHPDRVCLQRVSWATGTARELFCRASADHEVPLFALDAQRTRLLLANPQSRVGDYELLVVDGASGRLEAAIPTQRTALPPLLLDARRVLLQQPQGLALASLESGTVTAFTEQELGGALSYPATVPDPSSAWVVAVRRERGPSREAELVRIDLPLTP